MGGALGGVHFVSIGKEINSVLERVEHRSSPQVQQKGPSCDGPIWWFEIAGKDLNLRPLGY